MITKEFKLIDGIFDTHDARKVLLNLIDHKIHHHELKVLTDKERFGSRDHASVKRLTELRETKAELVSLIKAAEENGHNLVIHSNIAIETIADASPVLRA